MQTSKTSNVLILDANQRSALAVTRSLGRHGVPVITADESSTALAGCSRYSLGYHPYPSPRLQSDKFIETIISLCKKEDISMLMPMTELCTELLLDNRTALPDIKLPFTSLQTVNSLADKCTLMRLAESIDIPIPQTWHADNPAELPVKLDELDYPLVLKPGKSWLKSEGKWLHTTVSIAEDAAAATRILTEDPAYKAHPFMLQSYVPGSGGGVFAIYDRGKALALFAHRRVREKPPRGGVSVLSESAELDPVLEAHTRKLLDQANWHGVAMVEFRLTAEGDPYLMEVNTRFWGSLQLAVNAGVDFPWLLYQISHEEKTQPVTSYKTGTRLIWLLGNLDWLYLVLRDHEFSLLKKVSACVSFLKLSPLKTRCDVFRFSDFGPFWWEIKRYIKDLL